VNRRQLFSSSFRAAAAVGLAPQGAPAASDRIERARQAALEVLKATPAQVERGLDLHANSLVIESYGFSPRAAPDGGRMRAAIEAGASEAELEDLGEEMSMTRAVTDPAERAEYETGWRASGVTCILQNAGEEGQDPLRLLKRLARFTYVTDMLGGFVRKAATAEDIVAARKNGVRCLYFSGNGVPLTQQWISVEDEVRYIRIFFQLGIRMMHLTYNRRNMIGDGCAEASNAGLSDFGRAVIGEMNRAGVIVDCAHAGWRTSLEAARASQRPMVASHSCSAAVNRHIRAKPDEVIRAIADTGGYIGICAVPEFLGRGGDINAMLDHLDYVVRRFGADHAAIGTDVAYSSSRADEEYRKIPKRQRSRTRFEYFWPPGALGGGGAGLTLNWTNWPIFTVGMVQRGHSDRDIQKILGGNVLRVARAALAA
jgi:membrane dipeptidase